MSINLSKYEVRTDMIAENIIDNKEEFQEDKKFYYHTKRFKVELFKEKYNKKPGLYYTIDTSALKEHDHDELKELEGVIKITLDEVIEKNNIKSSDKCLVIGLGNKMITPDSLGPITTDKILVTRHLFLLDMEIKKGIRNVSIQTPGVMGHTGIETKDVLLGIIKETKPDFLIVVDALAAKNMNRMYHSIQITDAGINPGSGVGNNRTEISKETIGIPVIAIGVPTVVDVLSIIDDVLSKNLVKDGIGEISIEENNFVCSKDIDEYIDQLADIISNSINKCLHDAFN